MQRNEIQGFKSWMCENNYGLMCHVFFHSTWLQEMKLGAFNSTQNEKVKVCNGKQKVPQVQKYMVNIIITDPKYAYLFCIVHFEFVNQDQI